MSSNDNSDSHSEHLSFTQLMEEFEAVTREFDEPELDVERAVALHARGVKLLTQLEDRLTLAEQHIREQD